MTTMDLLLKNLRTKREAVISVMETITAQELIRQITEEVDRTDRALLSDEDLGPTLKLLLLKTDQILESNRRLMDQGVRSGDTLGITSALHLAVDVGLDYGGILEMSFVGVLTPADVLHRLQETERLPSKRMEAVQVFHGEGDARLPMDQSLDELGIQTGDRLIVRMEAVGAEKFPHLRSDMGTVYRIKGNVATVGRSDLKGLFRPDIDLRHEDEGDTVSRDHGQVVYQDQDWHFVENPEGTTNGTSVESTEKKLRPGEFLKLEPEMRIRVGMVWLTFFC
jgi:hypothetical protein